MKVQELMTPEVWYCAPSDSLNIAAKIMWERDCGSVPVVDKNLVPVGVLTDRDVCMGVYTQGLSLHALRAEDVMGKPVISCASGDDLVTAEKLMSDKKIRRLPVCDLDGKLVGIISLGDLARAAERERRNCSGPMARSNGIAQVLGAVSESRAHSSIPAAFGPESAEYECPPRPPIKRGYPDG